MSIGRPRKFKTPDILNEVWEKYKADCDDQKVLTHEFSAKNGEFVSKELRRAVTYTIEGFRVFAGISRQSFYDTYAENAEYADTVTHMREECEVDARRKFELGIIPTKLASLWMSRHGYTTKSEESVTVTSPTVISGGDALED